MRIKWWRFWVIRLGRIDPLEVNEPCSRPFVVDEFPFPFTSHKYPSLSLNGSSLVEA
jgi:hypothetical protein